MKYKKFIVDADLTAADLKFIEEHIEAAIPDNDIQVMNPFTYDEHTANPLTGTLINMVQDLAYNDFKGAVLDKWKVKSTNVVQKFDRARNIMRKLDMNLYFALLD